MTPHAQTYLDEIDVDDIIRALSNKGHEIFTDDTKNYNLNIVGIRSSENIVNVFNDYLIIFWKFQGVWHIRKWFITTDPGLYYLNTPINDLGTAILVEGQYRGAYRLGLHQGKYTALTQAKPVTVLRDFDRDDNHDFDLGVEDTGMFGINIHNSGSINSQYVNRWSAGCQVHADPYGYRDFLQVVKNSRDIWGNSFTYTLLTDKDV